MSETALRFPFNIRLTLGGWWQKNGFDPVTGLDEAATLTSYGGRFGDGDLLAAGLMAQGRCLLYLGRVPEGVRLLDVELDHDRRRLLDGGHGEPRQGQQMLGGTVGGTGP